MESRVIKLTSAAFKYGNLNIRPRGKDFFPSDCFGTNSRKNGTGKPITIHVPGISNPIKTDIPANNKTGRPRCLFRERSWVKDFVRKNSLISGDKVEIRHKRNRTYELIPHKRQLTFIDLFAGIGGTRIAFEKAGCKCVFSSEWNKFAQQTYEANFGEKPKGDITQIPSSEIPDHDILVAGFP